eukprot:scaffold2069_cov49-Phaeocystis_antarctica.AAC.1
MLEHVLLRDGRGPGERGERDEHVVQRARRVRSEGVVVDDDQVDRRVERRVGVHEQPPAVGRGVEGQHADDQHAVVGAQHALDVGEPALRIDLRLVEREHEEADGDVDLTDRAEEELPAGRAPHVRQRAVHEQQQRRRDDGGDAPRSDVPAHRRHELVQRERVAAQVVLVNHGARARPQARRGARSRGRRLRSRTISADLLCTLGGYTHSLSPSRPPNNTLNTQSRAQQTHTVVAGRGPCELTRTARIPPASCPAPPV